MNRKQKATAGMSGVVLASAGIWFAVMESDPEHARANVQDDNGCEEISDWPFETISCEMFQVNGARVSSADPGRATSVSPEQAEAAALRATEEGSLVRETRLVELWSIGETGAGPRVLAYAVVLATPGGPAISGGGILAAEINKATGGEDRPLTAEEGQAVSQAVNDEIQKVRASVIQSFHVAYVDPATGEWIGAREGVRTR